jgi:hypothetical protein
MKGWERDLLDHLAWLTVIGNGRQVAYADARMDVERELPLLATTVSARTDASSDDRARNRT